VTQPANGVSTATFTYGQKDGFRSVTSDSSINVAQWFDYAPYGSVIATTNTGQTSAGRQFEGLFNDSTNLVYSNARYLNPGQGQFTTEDPVFWGKQNIADPQSFNAYAYAGGNPIIKEDPTGQCPWCLIAIGLGTVGGLGQQGLTDVVTNYTTNGFDVKNYQWSPGKDYLYSAGSGAALGLAVSGGAFLEIGAAAVATVAGGGTVASDVVRDKYVDHTPVDPWSIGFDAVTTGATAGLIDFTPKIRGRLPGAFTNAFFTGSHTTNEVLKTTVGAVSSGFSTGIYNGASNYIKIGSNNQAGVPSGGGGNSGGGGGSSNNLNLISLYQSLVTALTSIYNILSGKH
jgi:RHS repeat-associated protein